jgi:predicted PurR-regulated permease PerM
MTAPATASIHWSQVWHLLSVGMCLVVAVTLLLFFKDVVILLSVVVAVAYALSQPHEWLVQLLAKGLPQRAPVRFLALLLVLVGVGGLIAACGVSLWPLLKADIRQLMTDVPELVKRYGIAVGGMHGDAWAEVAQTLGEWAAHLVAHGLHSVAGLILVIYLLLDGSQLRQGIQRALPDPIAELMNDTHRILKASVSELLLVSLFAGLVMTGVYSMLGFKYALLLGVFNGLCHALPVAGPWLGLLPGLALSLLSPHPEPFGWLLLWAGGLYLVKEYVILPYIIGNALEIHPVFVVVAFLAGMELFGLWGALFMALPMASLLGAMAIRLQRPPKLLLGLDEAPM